MEGTTLANELNGKTIAILANDGFEELELTEPLKALRAAGAKVDVIAPHSGTIQAFRHDTPSITVPVDKTLDDVQPTDYDSIMLPGGALNADSMRMLPKVQQFISYFNGKQLPMAVICHAPWELASAGVLRGRTLTSWPSIQDDLKNAGATWVDREVVIDGNLVTSRKPDDLPAFNTAMVKLFEREPAGAMR